MFRIANWDYYHQFIFSIRREVYRNDEQLLAHLYTYQDRFKYIISQIDSDCFKDKRTNNASARHLPPKKWAVRFYLLF